MIPAAYRRHSDPLLRCKWTADQAQEWFAFLASDLQHRQGGTTEFAWWKLAGAAPKALAGVTVGVVAGIAGALGLPFVGTGLGFVLALLVGLVIRSRFRHDGVGLSRGLSGGVLGGLGGGIIALLLFGAGVNNALLGSFVGNGLVVGIVVAPLSRFVAGIAGGFVGEIVTAFYEHAAIFQELRTIAAPGTRFINGLGLGLAAGLAARLLNRYSPARGLHWSWPGFVWGLAVGLVTGFTVWVQAGPVGGLTVGIAASISIGYVGGVLLESAATGVTKASSPTAVLRRDLFTFSSSCLGLALAVGLTTGTALAFSQSGTSGLRYDVTAGLEVGLTYGLAAGLAFAFMQACWGSFTLAKWWLAMRRRLPWRLMTFLGDAHTNRGILQQVGSVYQFRHVELQRSLARNL